MNTPEQRIMLITGWLDSLSPVYCRGPVVDASFKAIADQMLAEVAAYAAVNPQTDPTLTAAISDQQNKLAALQKAELEKRQAAVAADVAANDDPNVTKITDANLANILALPQVVVKVWRAQCPTCSDYLPVFAAAAKTPATGMTFASLRFDDPQPSSFKRQFLKTVPGNLLRVPMTLLLRNGAEVRRQTGAMTSEQLSAFISG